MSTPASHEASSSSESGFATAHAYRDLEPPAPQNPERSQTEPEVHITHTSLPDIPSSGDGFVAGILAQSDSSEDESQVNLGYTEAPIAHHPRLAQELWGNEKAVGLQTLSVGGHQFGMVSRYNLNPEGVYLQIITNGDWDNEPVHSVVRQTIADVGTYLLLHPHNQARQSTPHVTVNLSEGDHGSILKTYNPRQLELLKDAVKKEAA